MVSVQLFEILPAGRFGFRDAGGVFVEDAKEVAVRVPIQGERYMPAQQKMVGR